MADTVTVQVLTPNAQENRYSVQLTGISDGTGETNVSKVTRAALRAATGYSTSLVNIAEIAWNIQGFSYIKLSVDHTTDQTLLTLNGNGYRNFEADGYLKDADAAGGTGDLLLSSVGAVSGATYSIHLTMAMKP